MRTPFEGRHISRRSVLTLAAGAATILMARRAGWAQSPAAAPAKVGVIGSGHIGSTVGTLLAKAGHPVLFSSRHPEELKDLVAAIGPLAKAGTPDDAIAFGDVIMLAVPFKAYPQIGRDYAKALAGKIVLDAGNATAARDGELATEVQRDGIGAVSSKYLPGTRLVRAFNTLSYKVLAQEAHRSGDAVAIPIAGDDQAALGVAAGLVRDAGFDPVVVGGLARAREFQMGAPGYGQAVPAAELRKRLGPTQ